MNRCCVLQKLPHTASGVLINGGILIEFLSFRIIDKTTCGNGFHIDLDALSGIFRLLTWKKHLG